MAVGLESRNPKGSAVVAMTIPFYMRYFMSARLLWLGTYYIFIELRRGYTAHDSLILSADFTVLYVISHSKSTLNSLEYCWTQLLHRIFKISSNVNFKCVSHFTNLLLIKYHIDLRKLRFWHTVHSAVLIGCSELVLDVLCKRTVKNLLTVYDVSITDSFEKYFSSIWRSFKNELLS